MSKAVLISIRPKWCELIASGKKTIEVRKTRPKLETPFKCYIYCTKASFEHEDFMVINAGCDTAKAFYGGGFVLGEFICDDIRWNGGSSLIVKEDREEATRGSCVSREKLFAYLGIVPGTSVYDKRCEFYCWHISDLVIYDDPKKLGEFTGLRKTKFGYAPYEITRPPQSWCYVEALE